MAAGVALALAATGCGKDEPGDGAAGGGSGGGSDFGSQEIGEGVAGRDPGGIAEARRLGLKTVYFDFDQSALREDSKRALQHNYDVLKKKSDVRVELQGNCDERGSSEYNFALGERRAQATREFLVRLGIPGSRITTVSFGEENPAVVGHSEAAWAKNRRADFAVVR